MTATPGGRGLAGRIQDLLDARVAAGDEDAVQVAVVHRGDVVVDAAAGPVDPGTLFYAASTAKGIASSVAHALVERGELSHDLQVANVWPESAARGKSAVTVRHVLLHTAGVPAPPYDTTVEDLCDWTHMCGVLAAAEPWWEPGSRFGYHAQTFGFLLGETIRRATGRTISEALLELAAPLGMADEVHFGVPDRLLDRVVHQVATDDPLPAPVPGSPADRAIPPGIRPGPELADRRDVLSSDIPSGGTMSARGAALLYAAVLGHGPGPRLVSPERLADLAQPKFAGHDEVMDLEVSWAFGYSHHRPGGASRPGSTFGMVGMNGSAAYADIDTGVAVAVMRNRWGGADPIAGAVDGLVVDAFG